MCNPPSLSAGESPYHLFAAPLSLTLYSPSPVSPAYADILAMGLMVESNQQSAATETFLPQNWWYLI